MTLVEKRSKRTQLVAYALIGIMLAAMGYGVGVWSAPVTSFGIDGSGNLGVNRINTNTVQLAGVDVTKAITEETASYVVWVDGATYYARNGHTGAVTSNANAGTVIQAGLTAGHTNILLKDGVYYLSTLTGFYAGGSSSRMLLINTDYTWLHGSKNTVIKIANGVTVGNAAPNYEHVLTMLAIDADHVKISDIQFDANFDNVVSSYCSAIWTGDNAYDTYNPSYVEITGCSFTGTKGGAFYGDDANSAYWDVHDNYFTSAAADTDPYGIAFHNSGGGSKIHDNTVVAGNVVNTGVGIFIDGPNYVNVYNNHISFFCQGISLNCGGAGPNNYALVEGNIIQGSNSANGIGILITSSTSAAAQLKNRIVGNTLSGRVYQMNVGIHVYDSFCQQTYIDGNEFDGVTNPITDSGTATYIGKSFGVFTAMPENEIYEGYTNHMDRQDNFFTNSTTALGSDTYDLTTPKWTISSGAGAGDARLSTKKTYTLSNKPIIVNIIIQDITTGTGSQRETHLGLNADFTIFSANKAAFCQMNDNSWHARTMNGTTATDTALTSPVAGDLLTIVATSSQVDYYVNGVWLVSHTTNIPETAMYVGAGVIGSAGTVTVARSIALNYLDLKVYK
jgi:hypothetical protein